jgi:hypothetical protein
VRHARQSSRHVVGTRVQGPLAHDGVSAQALTTNYQLPTTN